VFDAVDPSHAAEVARSYMAYYEVQRDAGVPIDNRAFEPDFAEQMRVGYPFHPELIRLFAERLADIPEFQVTRGALRLVARTIRGVWDRRRALRGTLLLQPQHVDLSRSDLRDEVLARLGRSAFERGLDADVVRPEGKAVPTRALSKLAGRGMRRPRQRWWPFCTACRMAHAV